MAFTFNESSVLPEVIAPGIERKRLLTPARLPRAKVTLDRVKVGPGKTLELTTPEGDLAWLQILKGESLLTSSAARLALAHTHVVLLPANVSVTATGGAGALFLHARIPNAFRYDPALAQERPQLRVVDWSREPVLNSEHDARKRVYIVTPKLFGTKAVKGEMIFYPPGTEAANHHHEGADHFMYVLKGRGTAFANEKPIPVRAGDVIYYDDCERHYLRSQGEEEMVFAEFFVPGTYKTVWSPGAAVCTWNPTGRTIGGETPVRDIQRHSSAMATPHDV